MKVIDSILISGISERYGPPIQPKKKLDRLLKQTGMLASKNKKIEELSKGMGQIIQFIVTIIHNPDLDHSG